MIWFIGFPRVHKTELENCHDRFEQIHASKEERNPLFDEGTSWVIKRDYHERESTPNIRKEKVLHVVYKPRAFN